MTILVSYLNKPIKLKLLQVVSGKSTVPMAIVHLDIKGKKCVATAEGNGPIDASFRAVQQLVKKKVALEEFLVQAITRGSDDVGKVHIQLEHQGKRVHGFGVDEDIITASVEALIDAFNKIV